MEEEFSYRKYINSDFSSYCDLFQNVYSHEINSEFFKWKHNLNGSINKEPFIYLVFNKTGNLIGANSFFKSKFKKNNKIYTAIQSGDTMVHMDYRGKGIFKKIIVFAMEDLKNYGFDFIFGFANNNSHPGFIKLGFKSMYKVNNYLKILNYELIFKNKLRRIPFGGLMGKSIDNFKKNVEFNSKYSVMMTTSITEEMISFISSNMNNELGQIKDEALLNWKYVNNPKPNYEMLIIKKNSIIEGVFIVRIEKDAMKSVTVMEYFIKNNEDVHKILKAVIQYYRNENMGYLRSWELGSSVYKDALSKNHLIKKNLEIYFIAKLINESATEVLDLNLWHIVNGDADTV
ncbi:GNAT family N-acetyltransferase [Clostridium sp.]|uniref:GNAT family N-acetyltransferase n=1 Tax=Clostridium sp. TaxID=1506 RepID=UPI003D6D69A9